MASVHESTGEAARTTEIGIRNNPHIHTFTRRHHKVAPVVDDGDAECLRHRGNLDGQPAHAFDIGENVGLTIERGDARIEMNIA